MLLHHPRGNVAEPEGDQDRVRAGVPPNTGNVWGVGRHLVTFDVYSEAPGSNPQVKLLMRNITDSTDAVSKTLSFSGVTGVHKVVTLAFDVVAAKAYLPQVDGPD